jgi:hypothetical protein
MAPLLAGSLVTCRRQLREKIPYINKVVVKDLPGFIQQAEDCGIPHRIVDVLGFFPAKHDVALAQDCKLLRQRALLDVEPIAQVVYADLTATQAVQNPDSEGMGQGLEELSRKLGKFRHR